MEQRKELDIPDDNSAKQSKVMSKLNASENLAVGLTTVQLKTLMDAMVTVK